MSSNGGFAYRWKDTKLVPSDFLRQRLNLACTNHTCPKQPGVQLFCSPCCWATTTTSLPLLSTPTPPPGAASPYSTLFTFPRIENLRPKRDASPINHLYCTPIILRSQTQETGFNSHTHRADSVCCLQPLIPALIVGLCIIAA